jgi:hypothetical protein
MAEHCFHGWKIIVTALLSSYSAIIERLLEIIGGGGGGGDCPVSATDYCLTVPLSVYIATYDRHVGSFHNLDVPLYQYLSFLKLSQIQDSFHIPEKEIIYYLKFPRRFMYYIEILLPGKWHIIVSLRIGIQSSIIQNLRSQDSYAYLRRCYWIHNMDNSHTWECLTLFP